MKNNLWKACLILTALTAMLSMAFLLQDHLQMRRQLSETSRLLSESRNNWETTAAEKETLQDNLKKLESDLREAELSLTEYQEKGGTLTEEIELLENEIVQLKETLSAEH